MPTLEPNTSHLELPTRSQLIALADAYGVAHEYWEVNGTYHEASDDTLSKVLGAMGVDVSSAQSVCAETDKRINREWYRVLPQCTVVTDAHGGEIFVHVPHGASLEVWIETEAESERRDLAQLEDFTEPRDINGVVTGQARFAVPAGLPTGYHTIRARVTPPESAQVLTAKSTLIVAPQSLDNSRLYDSRSWGMMAQLYSVRSAQSWGLGDTEDLRIMAKTFGDDGADFLLINPVHAGEPVGHMQPSPYLPVSRRFFNPIYIRPENIEEWQTLSESQCTELAELSMRLKAASCTSDLIDRAAVWDIKRRALEIVFAQKRSAQREQKFAEFRKREGAGLENFALWCALQEKNGGLLSRGLMPLGSPDIEEEREALADRIDFWAWLQWVIDEQLEVAQCAALQSGMKFGICHDLAVGVHPHGADVWTQAHAFAHGMQVGAPPDFYNQQGQNWSQPPWNPAALEELEYAPLRDMVRTIARHAGALRIDHVMGLFRLYWIPQGNLPIDGTYVYFNHEAMLGVLLLEAQRAGVVVIGEDLGTVDPWVRDVLHARGVYGTSVFWFEKQSDGWPVEPSSYREDVLATVDTHDLPPALGYWHEDHVTLRASLGLLTEPEDQVRAAAAHERYQVMERLREHRLVGDDPCEQEIIEALHAYVCRTPSRLVGVSLTDAVGERKTQNQPGTDQEYPNWRVPLCGADGEVVFSDAIHANDRYRSLVELIGKSL